MNKIMTNQITKSLILLLLATTSWHVGRPQAHGAAGVGLYQQSVSNQGEGRAGNEPESNYGQQAASGPVSAT